MFQKMAEFNSFLKLLATKIIYNLDVLLLCWIKCRKLPSSDHLNLLLPWRIFLFMLSNAVFHVSPKVAY